MKTPIEKGDEIMPRDFHVEALCASSKKQAAQWPKSWLKKNHRRYRTPPNRKEATV